MTASPVSSGASMMSRSAAASRWNDASAPSTRTDAMSSSSALRATEATSSTAVTSIDTVPAKRGVVEIRLEHQSVAAGNNCVGKSVGVVAHGEGAYPRRLWPVACSDVTGIRYDVVGIGNALVDVIAHADDAFIDRARPREGVDDAGRHRPGVGDLPGAGRGDRDERRLGGQHDVRRRLVRGHGGIHRQGQRRRARQGVRSRLSRRRRAVPAGSARRRNADRPVHHRGHARTHSGR